MISKRKNYNVCITEIKIFYIIKYIFCKLIHIYKSLFSPDCKDHSFKKKFWNFLEYPISFFILIKNTCIVKRKKTYKSNLGANRIVEHSRKGEIAKVSADLFLFFYSDFKVAEYKFMF